MGADIGFTEEQKQDLEGFLGGVLAKRAVPVAVPASPPLAWAPVALANLSAMTLFLWHQSAFLAVTMTGSLIGRLPGLLTPPTGAWWIAERLAWLPAYAAALALAWLVFPRAERPRRRPGNPRGAGVLPGRRADGQPAGPDGQPSAVFSRSSSDSCSSHNASGR